MRASWMDCFRTPLKQWDLLSKNWSDPLPQTFSLALPWRIVSSRRRNVMYLEHFLWNYPQVNAIRLHLSSVNIGSDNGLVPSGNKPLPEPVLTQIYVAIWCHQAKMSWSPGNQFHPDLPHTEQQWWKNVLMGFHHHAAKSYKAGDTLGPNDHKHGLSNLTILIMKIRPSFNHLIYTLNFLILMR